MKTRALVGLVCFVASSVLAAATAESGRFMGAARPGVTARPVQPGLTNSPEDFGTAGDTVSTFMGLAFRPDNSSTTFTSSFGEVWPTLPVVVTPSDGPNGLSGPVFSANLQVPEGAIIDYITLTVCNENGMAAPLVFGGGVDVNDFADVSTTVTNGCAVTSSELIGYQVTANAGHSYYLFVNWLGGPRDGTVRFSTAAVWWHRSVSPAPANATFGDVPTSDPGFQYIEALVASGITAGCGGGNYCPDATLTRRQMAVFLAKGLGLYWPNNAP